MPDHIPRRIACLQPSATVILVSLGKLDRVVACTKYCADVVPEVLQGNRLIISDSWSSKADEILAAKPDLVIAAVPYQPAALAEILKAGVRFLGLAPRTLEDIYADIALLGAVVEARDRGAHVVSGMQREIEAVSRKAAGLPRKRVFCEEWGKPLIASQPWVAELVQAAGESSLASRANKSPTNSCSSAILKSSLPPGAARVAAFRWKKLLTAGTGPPPPQRGLLGCTAFPTNC